MRSCRSALLVGLVVFGVAVAFAAPSEQQARESARRFGEALEARDAAQLKPILPAKGKILLRLDHMGPEEGFFSASQVQALFQEFLDRGSVAQFEVARTEHDERKFALVQARARVTDALGREALVSFQLAFAPEGERWILREIRETPR